jgi:hypothetical protein
MLLKRKLLENLTIINQSLKFNPDKYKKRNQNLLFVEKELDLKIGQETFPLEATLQIEYKIFALDRSKILCHLTTFLKSSLFLALKIKVRKLLTKKFTTSQSIFSQESKQTFTCTILVKNKNLRNKFYKNKPIYNF